MSFSTIKIFEESQRGIGLHTAKKGDIEKCLREALALGRDQVLAQDRRGGEVLDTGEILRQQASALTGLPFMG